MFHGYENITMKYQTYFGHSPHSTSDYAMGWTTKEYQFDCRQGPIFKARSPTCEKQLYTSSYVSVYLSVSMQRIFMKFDV